LAGKLPKYSNTDGMMEVFGVDNTRQYLCLFLLIGKPEKGLFSPFSKIKAQK
jgi:hypothetical protein